MKISRFSEPQIIGILKQSDSGVPVAELCRQHGMSSAAFYKWRSKYGGMDVSMMSEKKALEDENRRLKRMFADLSMQNELLKEALGKKCLTLFQAEQGLITIKSYTPVHINLIVYIS